MTIEKRARAYTNRNGVQFLSGFEKAEYDAYIKGATEQREIDHEEWQKDLRYVNVRKQELIDKACEWLKAYRQETADGLGYIAGIINDRTIEEFRKAMEE